jgi:hypothetical protein
VSQFRNAQQSKEMNAYPCIHRHRVRACRPEDRNIAPPETSYFWPVCCYVPRKGETGSLELMDRLLISRGVNNHVEENGDALEIIGLYDGVRLSSPFPSLP